MYFVYMLTNRLNTTAFEQACACKLDSSKCTCIHVCFYTRVIVKMCRYACKSSIGITLVTKNLYPHVTKVIGYCIVEKSTEAISF